MINYTNRRWCVGQLYFSIVMMSCHAQGIPQGSVLSTLLCNLHFARMEKDHIYPKLPQPNALTCFHELIMRYTDDFFFCTTSRERAAAFSNILHAGLPEYGCTINPSKTLVNFECWNPCSGEKVPCITNDEIPWCGFMIDTSTLQVGLDFSRYLG